MKTIIKRNEKRTVNKNDYSNVLLDRILRQNDVLNSKDDFIRQLDKRLGEEVRTNVELRDELRIIEKENAKIYSFLTSYNLFGLFDDFCDNN